MQPACASLLEGKSHSAVRRLCDTLVRRCHADGIIGNHIDQAGLLAVLLGKLREAILVGGHREVLRERIVERLKARQEASPAEAEGLRTRLASLDQEIQHGTRRLLRAPDDIADLLGEELSGLRRDRDRLAAELDGMSGSEPTDVEGAADAAVDRLWNLAEELRQAKPVRLRELLHRMVARIDLHFDRINKGTRTECPFSSGSIELRPDPILCSLVSRGDWI